MADERLNACDVKKMSHTKLLLVFNAKWWNQMGRNKFNHLLLNHKRWESARTCCCWIGGADKRTPLCSFHPSGFVLNGSSNTTKHKDSNCSNFLCRLSLLIHLLKFYKLEFENVNFAVYLLNAFFSFVDFALCYSFLLPILSAHQLFEFVFAAVFHLAAHFFLFDGRLFECVCFAVNFNFMWVSREFMWKIRSWTKFLLAY